MGESPSFTATQDEYGRVAHTPLQQHRVKEGGRLALLYRNTAAMWASHPHSDRGLLYSQSAMAQTSPPIMYPLPLD